MTDCYQEKHKEGTLLACREARLANIIYKFRVQIISLKKAIKHLKYFDLTHNGKVISFNYDHPKWLNYIKLMTNMPMNNSNGIRQIAIHYNREKKPAFHSARTKGRMSSKSIQKHI